MGLCPILRADLRRACARAPGVHAVAVYRFGRWLAGRALPVRLLLELPRVAQIGPGLYIGHFGGITLAPRTVIGRNCNLSQSVTIGFEGHGANAGVPIIGDDVYIAPGARLLGRIRIGDHVKIGANAVVYRDVPGDAVVVLDPGFRIVSFKGNRRRPAAPAA